MLDGNDGRGGAGRVEMPPGPDAGLPGVADAGRAACGRSGSFGRSRDGAGLVGMAGTAEVPGADGSSIRSRMLGGTIRPGAGIAGFAGGCGATVSVTGGAAATAGGVSSIAVTGGGGATGSGVTTATGGGGGGATSCGGGGSNSTFSSIATGGAAGLAVLTSRGGANVGVGGLGGSDFFSPAAGFLPFDGGPSANMPPLGSVIPRSRASRSTNWRATTSSRVLDALFSSIPCARFNSASTSWLLVFRSSATL